VKRKNGLVKQMLTAGVLVCIIQKNPIIGLKIWAKDISVYKPLNATSSTYCQSLWNYKLVVL